jgi:TPR repeat protein
MKKYILLALFSSVFILATPFGDGFKYYKQKNYDKAYEIFYTLASNGDPKSQYNIATLTMQGKGVKADRKKAFTWYKRAANAGHGPSMYSLAHMYQQDAIKDPTLMTEVKVWYEKAMALDVRQAYTNMGFLYYTGYGKVVPKNIDTAIELFSQAAAMGDSSAMLNLGVLYGWKKDVPSDKLKAHKYLIQAINGGQGMAGIYLDKLCLESPWVCK